MALTFPQGSTFDSVMGSRGMGSMMGGGSMGGGGAGNLTPAPPYSWSAAYGGIPQVPSPGASSANAISSNLSNLSSLYRLAGGLNNFNQQQMESNLASALPFYEPLTLQSSSNIGAALRGQVAPDVVNELLQGAAERGIATGTYGSDNSNAAYLRALGLTSLDMQNRGEQWLTGAVQRSPQAPLFNPTPLMPSYDDWQSAQMAANLYKSAPVPSASFGAQVGAGSGRSLNWAEMGPNPATVRSQLPSFGTGAWSSSPIAAGNLSLSPYGGGGPGPFTEPTDPNQAYANWSNWMSGNSGGTQEADWFYDPFSFGYHDLNTGGFSETGPGYFYAGENYDEDYG